MSRFPFGIAKGWYLLAYSEELETGRLLALRRLDRRLVVFRGASGEPSVLDAHCPHLGADLGVGGRIVDDTIQCPFHTTPVRMGVIGRIGAAPAPGLRAAFEAYMKEHAVFAEADFPIWENKLYRERPVLCDGDGPIADYRRWVARFRSRASQGEETGS